MLVTMGATGEEEEAAQRKERERANHNMRKRHLAILTVVLFIWLYYKWSVVSGADSTQDCACTASSH